MPGQDFGVYTGEAEAGTEVSSTYEGRHITVLETELIHPTHADNLVDAGDPVIICNAGVVASRGNGVGVALTSAIANTDHIAIDTEGIWNLVYFSYDDTGAGSDIIAGDELYIHDGSTGGVGALGTGDATISKRRNNVTQIPFGYALGTAAGGGTGQIPMKVHFDPICHWVGDDELMQFGDGNGGGPGTGGGDVTLGYDEAADILWMLPEDNGGSVFNIGNGTNSMDVEIFGPDATQSMLYDSSHGTLDIVDDVIDADATLNITCEDSGTHTGSGNGIHVGYTKMTGAITGAGAISAINGDVQARADCTHVYAFKGYTGVNGSPTLGYMTGFYVYCDDLGTATVAHYQCADFNIASNNPATAGNCFIRMYAHGAAAYAALYFPSATGITNLLFFEQNVAPLSAGTDNTNVTLRIACQVGAFGGGTTHYLRLFSD